MNSSRNYSCDSREEISKSIRSTCEIRFSSASARSEMTLYNEPIPVMTTAESSQSPKDELRNDHQAGSFFFGGTNLFALIAEASVF